jgi:hypothetical protein
MAGLTIGEVTERCPLTGREVLPCDCGPHLECPEHFLNCVLGGDNEESSPEMEEA